MKKLAFNGTVVTKNRGTVTFDNIEKYNRFIVENMQDIESTTSTSKVVEVPDLIPEPATPEPTGQLKSDKVKLSIIFDNAIANASKYIGRQDDMVLYDKIGADAEKYIKNLYNNDELIHDEDDCKISINEAMKKCEDSIDVINKQIASDQKEIEDLESKLKELKQIQVDLKTDLASMQKYYGFIDCMNNMYHSMFLSDENSENDIETDVVEKEAQKETAFSVQLDLDEFINKFFGGSSDVQVNKNLKGIARLMNEILANE